MIILFSTIASASSVTIYLVWRSKALKDQSFPPRGHVNQIVLLTFIPVACVSFLLLHLTYLRLLVILVTSASLILLLRLSLLLNNSSKDIECASITRLNQNGSQVEYAEAFRASGQYPRNYLSEEFFKIIQYDFRRSQPLQKNSTELGKHTDWNRNIRAPNYNVMDGIRLTTDQPTTWHKSCSIFSTSQTFGEEVPDDLTCASFLQRFLNASDAKVRIINHSRPGSTLIERVNWFINSTPVVEGDIFIFLFGSNDCGWHVKGKGKYGRHHLAKSPLLRIFDRYATQTEDIHFVHRLLKKHHNVFCSRIAVSESVTAMENALKFGALQKVKILFVLQPVLWFSKTNSDYEMSKKNQFSDYLEDQIKIAYPMYEEVVAKSGFASSITTIFDGLASSVYLDWCHVNARGHELIAKALKIELDKNCLV